MRAWIRNFAPRLDGPATSCNTSIGWCWVGTARRCSSAAVCRTEPFAHTLRAQAELEMGVRGVGFRFQDILYKILLPFCDFLPQWRLTPTGILELKTAKFMAGVVARRSTL